MSPKPDDATRIGLRAEPGFIVLCRPMEKAINNNPRSWKPTVFIMKAWGAPVEPSSLIDCVIWLYPGQNSPRLNNVEAYVIGPTTPQANKKLWLFQEWLFDISNFSYSAEYGVRNQVK